MPRKKSAKKKLLESLSQDTIIGLAMSEQMHAEPQDIHREAAYMASGVKDVALVPHFDTLAGLLVWVRSVKAARGNAEAWSDFADRFEPKPARPAAEVHVHTSPGAGDAAPVASTSSKELVSAQSYYDNLNEKLPN